MANLTDVRLLSVPFENDYQDTPYFSNKLSQYNYFNTKVKLSMTNCTYQRKDNIIRFNVEYDKVVGCNYVMYRNNAYPESDDTVRWYYAFITDIRYINDGLTEVSIETDVIQTWLFDYVVKQSWVEREHVDDDTLGLHTFPELLETGEYICNGGWKTDWSDDVSIVIGVTGYFDENDEFINCQGGAYNGIYSAVKYYHFGSNASGISALNSFIEKYQRGRAEAIVCVFLAPSYLCNYEGHSTEEIPQYAKPVKLAINHSDPTANYSDTIYMTHQSLEDYVPRNKKLMCFPYRYLLVSNNNGVSVTYPFENFYTYDEFDKRIVSLYPQFTIEGCLTAGGSIRMIPVNYKGLSRNDDEGINLGKYPICNWATDVYTNWLTQNSVNNFGMIAKGIGSVLTGGAMIYTGNPRGAEFAGQGAGEIVGAIGSIYEHHYAPPQVEGNTNCGDVVTASGQNDFHFYDMSIKKEYAILLDNYLDMFGYKVNKLKIPNKNHRARWWYTKLINANIDGNIPMNDLEKIKECYNNGIRFWKDTTNDFGMYNDLNFITTN